VIRDPDDPIRGGEGDLTLDGVLFCDTLAERREGNTINVVSETSFTSLNANMTERPITGEPKPGQFLTVRGTPFTDNAGGDREAWSAVQLNSVEIRSSSAPATYARTSTLEIGGPPVAGNGATLADNRAITVTSGTVRIEETADAGRNSGALVVDGGIYAAKAVRSGEITFHDNSDTGRTVRVRPSPIEASYTLSLPVAPPTSDGQVIQVDNGGQSQFVVPPISTITSGTLKLTGTKLWVGTAVTSGGTATFYPTGDGTPDGAAFINTVLYAHATPVSDTDVITASAFATRRSVSADGRVLTFNVLTGAVVDAGGHTVQYAPDGITVQALVVGI